MWEQKESHLLFIPKRNQRYSNGDTAEGSSTFSEVVVVGSWLDLTPLELVVRPVLVVSPLPALVFTVTTYSAFTQDEGRACVTPRGVLPKCHLCYFGLILQKRTSLSFKQILNKHKGDAWTSFTIHMTFLPKRIRATHNIKGVVSDWLYSQNSEIEVSTMEFWV